MTPMDFAQNLARSKQYQDRVLAVAIITRGLTDDDPATHRQGWPLNVATVRRAAEYLGLRPTTQLVDDALSKAPQVSDAMLNRS